MLAKLLILLTTVNVGDCFLFGIGGGCDACSSGGYSGGSYGQSYGQNYGQNYDQSYEPVQVVQQPRVTNGHYIIRSKVYQPYIRRTIVQLIPQKGQVVKPYSTEFVPDQPQVVSSGQSYEGSYQQPSYGGSSYGSYGQGSYDQSSYGQGLYGGYNAFG